MERIILDVDTGTDDAVAIMMALQSEDIEVLGICSVNGNRGIDNTTENTLRVVEYLGYDNVPVYKGCRFPMVVTLTPNRRECFPYKGPKDPKDNVHGDYLELPAATIKEQKDHAVKFIIDTIMASDGDISIVPVGPLTNIAMAMRIEPEICKKIKQIVIMGGGYRETNITATAEFNFWIDPEAAKIVMQSGCKIILVPLDATHKAAVSKDLAKEMRKAGTKASNYAAEIIETRWNGYKTWQPMEDVNTVPIHDALAVSYLINKDVLQNIVYTHVDVDISGGISDGQSVCDVEKRDKEAMPNAYVALSADKNLFEQLMLKTLSKKERK